MTTTKAKAEHLASKAAGREIELGDDGIPKAVLDAAKYLGFETLETRRAGDLDFHEVAVWMVKEALMKAWAAGVAEGATAVINANR